MSSRRSAPALSSVGEAGLIRRIAGRIRTDSSVVRGIGDDCAVLRGAGGKLLLFASDMLVEKVHFLRSVDPERIGWKALAVNLSDVAAMGGIPRHAVVSLGVPPGASVRFVDLLYRGLTRCAGRFGVNLVGGDTNRSETTVIDVAILGEVERKRLVLRSGARPGDHLLVTGRLGGSFRSGRHLTFTPRVREARALGARARLHAMIDLSDGLGLDLMRLCDASGVSAEIDGAAVPRRSGCSLEQAFNEGEDFELLIAAAPGDAGRLLRWAGRNLPCGLTWIGRVVRRREDRTVRLTTPPGMKAPARIAGFTHF